MRGEGGKYNTKTQGLFKYIYIQNNATTHGQVKGLLNVTLNTQHAVGHCNT